MFPNWMSYCDTPTETVELVEAGAEFADYNLDELLPVVCDLLRANRADLALPFFKRIYEYTDKLIDWVIDHSG